jgi:23S rRNA (guanine745-N1)-methyltransferase
MWACPHCRQALYLVPDQTAWVCTNRHQFDRAREGYVNLLPAHRKGSRKPGDNTAMVAARRRVHGAAVYQDLARAVQQQVAGLPDIHSILDSGCGEGYYSRAMAEALPDARICGVDISREAVRLAAREQKSAQFAVASSYELPLPDDSQNLVARLFAPAGDGEVARVLQPAGYYLEVSPAARHLWELREILYEKPLEHAAARLVIEGMQLLHHRECEYEIMLSQPLLWDLVDMTPYAHRSSHARRETLRGLESLAVSMAFSLNLFQLQ